MRCFWFAIALGKTSKGPSLLAKRILVWCGHKVELLHALEFLQKGISLPLILASPEPRTTCPFLVFYFMIKHQVEAKASHPHIPKNSHHNPVTFSSRINTHETNQIEEKFYSYSTTQANCSKWIWKNRCSFNVLQRKLSNVLIWFSRIWSRILKYWSFKNSTISSAVLYFTQKRRLKGEII